MADRDKGRSVPSGRLARLGALGRLAGGVAGGAVAEGARRVARGERPQVADLLATPGNIARVADQLGRMRGAAMKLGQMISLDAGDLLPPELSAILARLRNQAYHMPPRQLQEVLAAEWGRDWRRRFRHFDATPIAAASIGQVHRATTTDGRDLAIKVQYPGVARSIDADIDNVATLLRLSGLLPAGLDVAPLLDAAKQQLREEADYEREAAMLVRYGALVADRPSLIVPAPAPAFSTTRVLAMDFVPGRAVESLTDAPAAERDRVAGLVIGLVLDELFRWRLMQTDPNFANYRYQPETGRLVILDLGAAREVPVAVSHGYAAVVRAGLAGSRDQVRDAAVAAGFLGESAVERHRPAIDRVLDAVLAELNRPGPFDFGDRSFVGVVREEARAVAQDRAAWHTPSADLLFVQRKISGTALLAARLKARVDVRRLAQALIQGVNPTPAITTVAGLG
jgi:predicted unusual protein kinase regulating ubiquinone biosynthesis (AarF/ABC1/UbiB family)